MKIKKLKIENFRSAKELSIELSEELNVFAGINGSGKTTVLEALTISLSWLISRIQRQNSNGSTISENDIRHDSPFSTIEINCQEQNNNYFWRLVKNRESIKRQIKKIISLIKPAFSAPESSQEEFDSLAKKIIDSEFIYEQPGLLFYKISRLFDFTNSGFKQRERKILHELEEQFYQMQEYFREVQNGFFSSESNYVNIIMEIIESFHPIFLKTNPDDIAIKVIWELFIFANNLCLWWLNEKDRLHFETELRKSFQGLIKDEYKGTIGKIISSLKQIIKKEEGQKNKPHLNKEQNLKIITSAIEQFMPGYSFLRIKRSPRPHMLISKEGEEFDLNQMSDGEKNMITLVGDIARRLVIANPDSNSPLAESGIIIIDEIDLHLHPSWQRLIIPQLRKTFPGCQFIISTHSPQVLSHVKPENLFLLNNENNELSCSVATESYGKNSDRILEDLLGVDARPKEIKDRLKQLFILIENKELETAENELNSLSEILVGGDPELVMANTLITRKKAIGSIFAQNE
jgi:predicted ATP-binding protein involved in virulence